MKDLLTATLNALKTDQTNTLREISEATGIQLTRCFRLKAGKGTIDAEEFIKLADFYTLSPESVEAARLKELQTQLAKDHAEAVKRAYVEVYEKAEIKLAEKYGITPELLNWRLSAPVKVG
jgi:hypothetical protein